MDETNDQPQPTLPGFVTGGPYLALAVLCEKVLKEENGVISLIRIVDRITISLPGPNPPAEMPAAPINLTLVLGFKSGLARGAYTVRVRTIGPSQSVLNSVELPMLLEGDDRGAQIALALMFQAEEDGLFWFEVYLHDALITRVPLRVLYQRVSLS